MLGIVVCLCNDIQNIFKKEAVPSRARKQRIGIKSFYSGIIYGFEYKKNCISKLSIKMFIKRKTRAGKRYPYLMPLSLKHQ